MVEKRPADADLQAASGKRPRPESQVAVAKPAEVIDRTKRCPLLLRMFPRNGGHNRVTEYQRGGMPIGELCVHTWMDADLRELAELVKSQHQTARHTAAELEFALVFPDKRGLNVMRVVGTVSGTDGPDDAKTLRDIKFQAGDYMDVAVLLPRDRAPRPDRPPMSRGRGAMAAGGGPRPLPPMRPWR